METRTKLTDGLAKTINAAGSALVAVYDTGAGLLGCTLSKVLRCERSQLNSTIKEYESRILDLTLKSAGSAPASLIRSKRLPPNRYKL